MVITEEFKQAFIEAGKQTAKKKQELVKKYVEATQAPVICPFCGNEAEWVENKEIYGRNYGKSFMTYFCRKDDAYVGCHNNTREPLGTMADAELRALRKRAHKLFDPLWEEGSMRRPQAYAYLVKNTGVQHIAWTNKQECERVISFLSSELAERKG